MHKICGQCKSVKLYHSTTNEPKCGALKKNKPSQPNTDAKCTQLLNNNKKHYVKPLKPVSGPISDYENLTVL